MPIIGNVLGRVQARVVLPLRYQWILRRPLARADSGPIPRRPGEIRLFAKVRNESLRLPFLLEHYFRNGVDRAFIVDDRSTDGTREILLRHGAHVFIPEERFSESQCGQVWLFRLLHQYGRGHWCVVVDADEILAYPGWEKMGLPQLCALLDEEGAEALYCHLLDMYARGPFRTTPYREGDDPLRECRFFDREFAEASTISRQLINGRRFPVTIHTGGMRRRVFGIDVFCSKVPLLKYRGGLDITNGMHGIHGARVSQRRGAVLHFKYLHDFPARVAEESGREEHAAGAAEYKAYAAVLARTPDLSAWWEGSVEYRDSRQLVDLGIMRA